VDGPLYALAAAQRTQANKCLGPIFESAAFSPWRRRTWILAGWASFDAAFESLRERFR
jgi:hypothetical protein